MTFCKEMRPLYLEMDASSVGVRASLLQTKESPRVKALDNNMQRLIAFTIKNIATMERRYNNEKREALTNNIEREVLTMLHALENFNHQCFSREASLITDYKLLVAFFQKDVATLPQRLQCIIHQYKIRIIYKP